jgi:hypothetical protein
MYGRLLTRYPLATKSITSAVLVGLGDLLSQGIEMWLKDKAQVPDLQRISTMAIFGGVYVGPLLHYWYTFVLGRYFPSPSFLTVLKKTILDQTLFATFGCYSFFIGLTLLNGGTLEQGHTKVRKELWQTLQANWTIWPVVQLVNFSIVPIQYQVLVVNSVAVFWNAYLSYVQFTKK